MTAISATAIGAIHFHLFPRFHDPCLNESPARHRRKIGIAKATYSPMTPTDTTA